MSIRGWWRLKRAAWTGRQIGATQRQAMHPHAHGLQLGDRCGYVGSVAAQPVQQPHEAGLLLPGGIARHRFGHHPAPVYLKAGGFDLFDLVFRCLAAGGKCERWRMCGALGDILSVIGIR
jgi:hypothetical protein